MVNLPDYINSSGNFRTLETRDIMIVEYTCFVDDPNSDIWSHMDYFGYVYSGKKKWSTPQSEVLTGPGDIIYVRKGAHTVYQYFHKPFKAIFVFLTDDLIRSFFIRNRAFLSNPERRNHNNCSLQLLQPDQIVTACFHSLNVYLNTKIEPHYKVLQLKMEEFLLQIMTGERNLALKQQLWDMIWSNKVNLKEIMEQNFMQVLSLDDFARMCARSKSTFRRDFMRTYEMPPGKWLQQRRLDLGRFLLENTSDSIEEIMDQCGFINKSHFITSFRERYHITPEQFRHAVERG